MGHPRGLGLCHFNFFSQPCILSSRHKELLVAPISPISHSYVPSPTKPTQTVEFRPLLQEVASDPLGTSSALPLFCYYSCCPVWKLSAPVYVSCNRLHITLKGKGGIITICQCQAHAQVFPICSIYWTRKRLWFSGS